MLFRLKISYLFIAIVFLYSCKGNKENNKSVVEGNKKEVKVPIFNEDTAYSYVAKQVEFGPRVTGSSANKSCADYLTKS